MMPPGIHAHSWCISSVSTRVAAMTTSRNDPVEMNWTVTYFGEIWCHTPLSRASLFSDRGSTNRSNSGATSGAAAASVVVDAGFESGCVASGLFVIVVLPDGAQVLRDQTCSDQQGAAHGRRDDRCQRA